MNPYVVAVVLIVLIVGIAVWHAWFSTEDRS